MIALPVLTMYLTVVLGCLAYIGWLSPIGLLVVLCFMVVGIFIYWLPMIRASRHFRMSRQLSDSVFKGLRALTEGTKELKLHRRWREHFLQESLEQTIRAMQKESYRGSAAAFIASSWGQVLFFILVGTVLFVLPPWLSLGPAVLSGYALTILYMVTPLESILNMFPEYSQARAAIDHIENLGLQLLNEQGREPDTPVSAVEAWHELELHGVCHAYRREGEEDRFTLGPIDLRLADRLIKLDYGQIEFDRVASLAEGGPVTVA